ncbi:hypothetical protein [Tahibacter amnicola]|uniref:SMODS and SLOG-associating 2TM effector domain-containing protein n=1 Tax=Tahibacter amnicola TaxID=2976241 RepID=A0ABY6BID5_9GAMM|nr:hypothetical protein [Tahibacter amnicola]UXI69773.1 hypothetical protein N4264_09120 [Tahibacter amnicola]
MAIDPKWSTIRGFGEVHYFNVSYVVLIAVPILAQVLHFSSEPMLPMSVRWLYAASVFYAIGIAVYQYQCPDEIKRYASARDYIQDMYDIYLRSNPHRRLEIVRTQLVKDHQTLQRIATAENELTTAEPGRALRLAQERLDSLIDTLYPHAIQAHLNNDYHRLDATARRSRLCSFAAYLTGTIVLIALLAVRSACVFFGYC